jgi:homoserine O-succinyltransferase
MPDAVMEETEFQFSDLLHAASGNLPVKLKLFSLPGIPRGERSQQRVESMYFKSTSLSAGRVDAAIITGTEPRQSDLRREAYWPALANVLDWASESTISTVLSCLAAHAAVLHADGVGRRPLVGKQCGVFEFRKAMEDPLTARTGALRFPHSRWNEVDGCDLSSAGYSILTQSRTAGVDLFAKNSKKSRFVHFQGHPEYGSLSLFKEYRRDVKRFLKGERDTYPSMPEGYFPVAVKSHLDEFETRARSERTVELSSTFPETCVIPAIKNTWRQGAISIYRNWFSYIASRKGDTVAARVSLAVDLKTEHASV